MKKSPWQQRIRRAEELASVHPYAAEMLRFYALLTGFQEKLYRKLETASNRTPMPASHKQLARSEEHTSELQSRFDLVCRLLLEKKKTITNTYLPASNHHTRFRYSLRYPVPTATSRASDRRLSILSSPTRTASCTDVSPALNLLL